MRLDLLDGLRRIRFRAVLYFNEHQLAALGGLVVLERSGRDVTNSRNDRVIRAAKESLC